MDNLNIFTFNIFSINIYIYTFFQIQQTRKKIIAGGVFDHQKKKKKEKTVSAVEIEILCDSNHHELVLEVSRGGVCIHIHIDFLVFLPCKIRNSFSFAYK